MTVNADQTTEVTPKAETGEVYVGLKELGSTEVHSDANDTVKAYIDGNSRVGGKQASVNAKGTTTVEVHGGTSAISVSLSKGSDVDLIANVAQGSEGKVTWAYISTDSEVYANGLPEEEQNSLSVNAESSIDVKAIMPESKNYSGMNFGIYTAETNVGSTDTRAYINGKADSANNITVDAKDAVTEPSKMTLTYQWYLGGKSVSGATESTYTVSIEDLVSAGSKVLSCSVTDVLDKTLYSQEVTVLPLDLSAPNVDVDWEEEATYTGKKSFPKEISVTTTSYEVPEDMWKVTGVKGKNCVNPGKAWMKIKGTSEYVINSRKVQYTIKGQSEKKEAKAAPADLTVTDSLGAPKKYEVRIIEEISQTEEQDAEQEEAQTEGQAESVKIYEILTFDDNTVVGDTVYSQRNLHITRDMINKAKDAGCSSIRLRVADGGIDLAVSELSKDSYMVYFAPDDGSGVSTDEKAILDRYQPQGEIYRISVRAKNEYGEDVDVIDTMLKARVLLYGDRDEQTQFLLLTHDTLEPTVNNAEKKSADGDDYLSGRIYKRSMYTATLVD